MRLSKIVILALKGMTRDERFRLAQDMGVTEDTLYRWIRLNHDNFTKAEYMAVLRKEFGLTDEELLEQNKAVA